MSLLEIKGLSVNYGSDTTALDDVALSMIAGEFLTVVGPTNAGKSTLLKTIAGLERPQAGSVRLKGSDVTGLEPRLRNVSLLFQNIALFPTLSGAENIAFPLRRSGMEKSAIDRRVDEIAAMLKVSHVLDRLPRTFSGGEQQRVAIGRALAAPGDLLMLDEPLTNLDARIRIALRVEFKKLHRETGQSILYVTHDQIEAMSLSDRIAVLNEGRVEQVGTPDELYQRPATAFVAQFMGTPPMNLIPVAVEQEGSGLRAAGEGFSASIDGQVSGQRPGRLAIGVRPEKIEVAAARTDTTPFPGEILWIERLGSHHVLDVELGGEKIKVRTRADHPVGTEGPGWFGFTPKAEHVLDLDSGRFLPARPGAGQPTN